ncbi:MAG: hypothetical protein KJ645_05195, partial [Planctomycetes bacterium]|nr:hypothetical protein [Planctomycetota bacterium]
MRAIRTILIGLAVGFILGWLWGFIEGAGHISVHLVKALSRFGWPPPVSLIDTASIPLMAAAIYALVLAVLS